MKNAAALLLLSLSLHTAVFAAQKEPTASPSENLPSVQEPKNSAPELELARWKLVFASEFDSPDDLEKWHKQDQSEEIYNNELQAYVTDAYQVKDGCLYIEAQKRNGTCRGKLKHYTSGRMNTRNKFDIKYGRFEIRLKVPAGKGFWPAFWLLPSSDKWPPEIDFLEILGHQPERVYFTNHWGVNENGNHPSYGTHYDAKPDFSQEFHVVTSIWNEKEIRYYLDGKQVASSNQGIPQEKMYLLVNLAVGGDWPGSPDDKTVFPNNMIVDYVRVYEPVPEKAPASGAGP
jgi:beta-glucanase (GH16 family)